MTLIQLLTLDWFNQGLIIGNRSSYFSVCCNVWTGSGTHPTPHACRNLPPLLICFNFVMLNPLLFLTFILPWWVLKFTRFMGTLFEQKKIKLWNRLHFLGNKTEHVLKIQWICLLPKYVKLISRGVFLHVFGCLNIGL